MQPHCAESCLLVDISDAARLELFCWLTIHISCTILSAFVSDRPVWRDNSVILSTGIFQLERWGMSQHRSLKSATKIVAKRNTLKRFERIDLMRQRGKWKEGDRPFGLPKTKPS
ncbi:MAG: small basic protein [bacterium]